MSLFEKIFCRVMYGALPLWVVLSLLMLAAIMWVSRDFNGARYTMRGTGRKKEKGQALVEAAFGMAAIMLLFLGSADFLTALSKKSDLEYVTQRAAICSTIPDCVPAVLAQQNAANLGLNPAAFAFVANPDGSFTATYVYHGFSPFFNKGLTFNVTAKP